MSASRHSSHFCLGGWDPGVDLRNGADIGTVDVAAGRLAANQKERSCLFRHVCFDKQQGGWHYFAPKGEFRARRSFSSGVDIWARGDFGRASGFSVDHRFTVHHNGVPM